MTFIAIKTCIKCYSLEQHNTKDCPKNRDFKICSECSNEGHLWFNCKAEQKTCINCGGNHSTMAMKCTAKKELIKEKRKEENRKSKMTYSAITNMTSTQYQSQPLPPPTQPVHNITREETLKINICVAHAHYRNIEKPGSYAEELNKVLKANHLPTIIIPDSPNSQDICTNTTDEQISSITEAPQARPRRERNGRKNSVGNVEIREGATSTVNEIEVEEGIMAKDIGLKFYTTKERGWPQTIRFTIKDLIDGTINNTYKFSYENKNYSEEEIFQAVQDGQIILKDCWVTVDKDVFRKIRSGCSQERSPLEHKEHRLRKTDDN